MDGVEKVASLKPSWQILWNSTVGKKQIVALTGLSLVLFLVIHLLGNTLLLSASSDSFNEYAHRLTSTSLIYVAEAGLVGVFLLHLGLAMQLTLYNKQARPEPYYMKTKSGKGATIFSRSMPVSGLLILVFIILHLYHFKYGTIYMTQINGAPVRDLYKTVMVFFASFGNTAIYVGAMLALLFHLFHGIASTAQTLGFRHPRWEGLMTCAAKSLGLLLPLGFALISILCHLKAQSLSF
jgi:succinate dehydrogenase / fumarate reductase cytochrome b subunit